MVKFLNKRAQSIAQRLAALGDPLRWSNIDKCLLLLSALLLPFSLMVAAALTVLSFSPEFSALIGCRDPGSQAKWYWLNFLGYAFLFCVALVLRRRTPNHQIFVHVLMQYVWICMAIAVHGIGAFTSPVLIGVLGVWMVGCALFPLRFMAYGAGSALSVIVALTVAGYWSATPPVPTVSIPVVDGRPMVLSLLLFGSLEFAFLIAIMAVTGMLFAHLRERARELETLSMVDAMTQVFNRRSFLQTLEAELTRTARHRRNFALMMVDVDFFKNVNDGFGHLAGDQVLVSIASLLRDFLRRSDVIARFGGDEFIVLLPETDLQGVQTLAERFRHEVANMTILCVAERIPGITVSIGVATSVGAEGETVDGLIERADRALYSAKRNGRNRIEVAA